MCVWAACSQWCSHSSAESDRWNHFTQRLKDGMQKWGVLSPGAAVVGINLGQWCLALSESQALRQG